MCKLMGFGVSGEGAMAYESNTIMVKIFALSVKGKSNYFKGKKKEGTILHHNFQIHVRKHTLFKLYSG